jgi:thiosulfate/3-mercaptopyruvate sulfurtransferase
MLATRTVTRTAQAQALVLRLSGRAASTSSGVPLFLSASEYLKSKGSVVTLDTRSPQDFEAGHIPGSRSAHDVFTYLLPSSSAKDVAAMQAHFATVFGSIGLRPSDHVVVTEKGLTRGFGQSCRSWFLLRSVGHEKVSVLDGGIEAYTAAGGAPLEKGPAKPVAASVYPVASAPRMLATADDVMAVLAGKSKAKLLDVRDRVEWDGKSSSPYGVDFCPRKGRIPGAIYAEWYSFMEDRPGSVGPKTPDQVRSMMRERGILPNDEIIVYCFKGSRASNSLMILQRSGFTNVRNYFGSWNEWSRDNKYPVDADVLDN